MSDRPVFNQINIVVHDMAAMVDFYERLGVELRPTEEPWDRHHRSFQPESTVDGFDVDLDSSVFAGQWHRGWPPDQRGVVLGFRLPSAAAVDALYDELTSAGYVGAEEPHDSFVGARHAIVVDPDGNSVGLMGPVDPAARRRPPPPAD